MRSPFSVRRPRLLSAVVLGAVALGATPAAADDVVFLIDSSFSMATTDDGRVPRHQRAIERAMEDVKYHLNAHDTVVVVLFDSVAHSPIRLRTAEEAYLFFRDYEPSGDTNIIDALVRAFQEVSGRTRPLVYLYTDGEQTERATIDWPRLVALYNDYNASVPDEKRIRLYYMKWRGLRPNSDTDRWLRQIENTTELQSKSKDWGEVEKISFRPDDFGVTVLAPKTPGEIATPIPLRIEITDSLKARGIDFRIDASFPEATDAAVAVRPREISGRALAPDGTFGAELEIASTAGLEAFRAHALEIRFTVIGDSGDAKSLRVSPEDGVVRGTLTLSEEPAFTVDVPSGAGDRIEIADYEEGRPIERVIGLSWNRGANGRRIECLATFPGVAPAELFIETPAGREPILGGIVDLGDSGSARVVARLAPLEFAAFDGLVTFRGFGHERSIHVSHAVPTATVAFGPVPFEARLQYDPDRGPASGARSAEPLRLRVDAPDGARRLRPVLSLSATVGDARLELTPPTIALADLPADGTIAVEFALPEGRTLETGVALAATLAVAVESSRGAPEHLRLEPSGGRFAGSVTLVEEPAVLVAVPGGTERLSFGPFEVGTPAEKTFELAWNDGANGREIRFDLEGDAGLARALFLGSGPTARALEGGRIPLDSSGKAVLTLRITGSEKRPYGGRLTIGAFGRDREILFETTPAPGLVSVAMHPGLRGLSVSPEETVTVDGAFSIQAASVNALASAVSFRAEAPPGVAIAVVDGATGKEIPAGKPIPLPGVKDVSLGLHLRAAVAYDAYRAAPEGRIDAKVVFVPAAGSAVRFEGADGTLSLSIPIAVSCPEVSFERKGSPLVAISLGDTEKERTGDGFVVPFDVATKNVTDAIRHRFLEEAVRLEHDTPGEVVFRATGASTATLSEILKTPGLVVRPKDVPFSFDFVQTLGAVRFAFAAAPARLAPSELRVAYDRSHRLFFAAGAFLFVGLGAGGYYFAKKSAPKVGGTLVIERAAAGTASACRRFELGEYAARAIEVGLSARGDVQAEPALSRGSKVFRIRARRGGRVLVPLADDRAIFVDEEPVEKGGAVMHDMCMIEFDGYRIRYVSGVDDEEIVIVDDDDDSLDADGTDAAAEAEVGTGAEDSEIPIDEETLVVDSPETGEAEDEFGAPSAEDEENPRTYAG